MSKATNIEAIEFISDLQSKPTIVLLHGYGADASDLSSLRDYLSDDPDQFNWIFPEGIYKINLGLHMTGRAWWPLTMSSLPGDWSNISPPEIDDVRESLLRYFSSLAIPMSKLIIGGFSQGAMLATEIFLNSPEKPLGLISMSGSLIRKSIWESLLVSKKGSAVLLSHGEQDQVLPISGTLALHSLFKKNELLSEFVSFAGGHEIPTTVLNRIKKYIQNRTT